MFLLYNLSSLLIFPVSRNLATLKSSSSQSLLYFFLNLPIFLNIDHQPELTGHKAMSPPNYGFYFSISDGSSVFNLQSCDDIFEPKLEDFFDQFRDVGEEMEAWLTVLYLFDLLYLLIMYCFFCTITFHIM